MINTKGITIDDFCSDLSLHDKRIELIGGFHYWYKNKYGNVPKPKNIMLKLYNQYINEPA